MAFNKYFLVPKDQVMEIYPARKCLQDESAKESNRNFDILRSYYLSAVYHGGLGLEKKFVDELYSHIADYEKRFLSATLGSLRAKLRKMPFEEFKKRHCIDPSDFDKEKYEEVQKFFETGNRPTSNRDKVDKRTKEEKSKMDDYMRKLYENANHRIKAMYEDRTNFVPFVEIKEMQCAAIVNDDLSNAMCCGKPIASERLKFCNECLKIYAPAVIQSMFSGVVRWAKRQ